MRQRPSAALLFAVAALLAFLGYREFSFLTDDAYISFRYAANAMAGRGLSWNPPPFLPVEGYTNFAWVALLGGVWAAFGVEPPVAANPLSFACGLATLAIVTRLALRVPLPEADESRRPVLIALVLLGVVTNRTFLTWLSSGLETSLFNLTWIAWIAAALTPPGVRNLRTTVAMSSTAALAALTRPDGVLLVLASVPLAMLGAKTRGVALRREALAWSPLLLPVGHFLWRRAYYGTWLPNTWYAKHLEAWPESGVRYAASFALEYAVWFWLALALIWLTRRPRLPLHAAIVVGVVIAHAGYYTLSIGGDHFEYRVYSQLVPLLFLSALWLLSAMGARFRTTAVVLGSFILLSWPIPWAHHLATRGLTTRAETHELLVPVAPQLWPPFSWLAQPFDALQAWLIPRHVGMRHREHAVFHDSLERGLPSRKEGATVRWEERPVLAAGNVGLVGWVFPNVAIIDVLGLNDYVVARTPPPGGGERTMAHDRLTPPDYLACYRPNLYVDLQQGVRLARRESPLTDADIAACELTWRARAGQPIVIPDGMEVQRQ
jgi:arabinofuranosyltransferase